MIKKYISYKLYFFIGYSCDYHLADKIYKTLKNLCDTALKYNIKNFGKNSVNTYVITDINKWLVRSSLQTCHCVG